MKMLTIIVLLVALSSIFIVGCSANTSSDNVVQDQVAPSGDAVAPATIIDDEFIADDTDIELGSLI